MGALDHLISLLRNLYAGQEATVRTGHGTTDWFKIEKGVRQGCILSPCLFNLYAEHIMRKAGLDESPVGIKIAGRNINNLRYADDTSVMAESEEELKSLLMRVKEESAKVGLKLNIKKTKIMASSPLTSWQTDGEEMGVVTDFIFLGSKITADGDCSQAIKRHLLLGRKAMANLDSLLKSRDITLLTKVRIVKASAFFVIERPGTEFRHHFSTDFPSFKNCFSNLEEQLVQFFHNSCKGSEGCSSNSQFQDQSTVSDLGIQKQERKMVGGFVNAAVFAELRIQQRVLSEAGLNLKQDFSEEHNSFKGHMLKQTMCSSGNGNWEESKKRGRGAALCRLLKTALQWAVLPNG
ncbi:Retrovirus-related Pol polyprotein from type-2 retrotransposable element R2DM [Varanus komodoensis]|nr:Retrovirus-related Pol polyprotein from type-2 retrotransposable element R2DM [Varanus komodoensis]